MEMSLGKQVLEHQDLHECGYEDCHDGEHDDGVG
jgi:hypothetical protein